VSLTGYVIIASVLLLLGISFTSILSILNDNPTDVPLTELFYKSYYFWLILLLTAPVITMRSFASEKGSGTYETLMTTPVSDLQVVLAKFTGTLLFYRPDLAAAVRVHRRGAVLDGRSQGARFLDHREHVPWLRAGWEVLHVDRLFRVGADAEPDHRGDEQPGDRAGAFHTEPSLPGAGASGGLGGQGVFLHLA